MGDFSFLGPSAAVVIVVVLFLKFLTSVFEKLADSLNGLTESNRDIARATKEGHTKVSDAVEKQAKEAEARNGHLAELAIENRQAIMDTLSK